MRRLFLLLVVAEIAATVSANSDKIVCYYGSWAVYRPGEGAFDVEDFDPFLCTHAIYTFTGINSDGTINILDEWNDIDLKAYKRFNNLAKTNPELKTMVAIGGWNEGGETFSEVAGNAAKRQNFANSAVNFMRKYGFKGFDLDWEYPAEEDRGGRPEDKKNAVLMVQALRETFDASGETYLLSAAVGATGERADTSYDVPNLSKYLDFINLMAYDLHGEWDQKTGQNAPLYASSSDENGALNVDACVKAWISRGAPANKLILGMGTYGRSFTVWDSSNHGLNNPGGAGRPGIYTEEAGMLGYNEICEYQQQGDWTEIWDDEQKVPYAYKGDQWVGYDNERSIRLKAEYLKQQGLGGAMFWSIDTDDFRGKCGRKFPLISTVKEVLQL